MKKTLSGILVIGLIILSGFTTEPAKYEQIAFDYFVSDILKSDFQQITTIEFAGKTEESYSTLGKYKFCLKPEEKLGAIIEGATRGSKAKAKEIKYENIQGITILDPRNKASDPKLLIFPTIHVADNYYVFLSFQKPKEQPIKYVLELTPEGSISRSCKLH